MLQCGCQSFYHEQKGTKSSSVRRRLDCSSATSILPAKQRGTKVLEAAILVDVAATAFCVSLPANWINSLPLQSGPLGHLSIESL